METITRAEAKERGFKYYFTGCSCPKEHLCERFVSTRACVACVREKKSELYRSDRGKKLRAARRAMPENQEKTALKNASSDSKQRKLLYSRSEQGKSLKRAWYEKKRDHLNHDRSLDAFLASLGEDDA